MAGSDFIRLFRHHAQPHFQSISLNPAPPKDPTAPIRTAIWVYFWLMIVEGALRKWVFPGFSDLLFVIRDPVVVLAYGMALRAGIFPLRLSILLVGLMAALSLMFALLGNASVLVVLFGLRTDFLHLPLVFLMPAVMNRDDVKQIGRWAMILSVPILLLMIRQFNSAADDPINVAAGGSLNGQIRGAMGRIRPPGPFSFISGPVVYYGLVAAFVCHGWMERRAYPRWLLLAATVTTIAAVPISISRSLLMGVLIVLAFAATVLLRRPQSALRLVGPMAIGVAMFAAMADTDYVQAFSTRWEEAEVAGGGDFSSNVVGRLLELFTHPFTIASDAPIFGHGIGMGTLAGARLLTGQFTFALSESELGRNVMELGPILGFVFIAWRAWLAVILIAKGWQRVCRDADSLPWLLAGASFLTILIGQWGQATQLGFAVFGAGLVLAALNDPVTEEDELSETEAEEEEVPEES